MMSRDSNRTRPAGLVFPLEASRHRLAARRRRAASLAVERMEDRTLLATILVTSTVDTNTRDNDLSLREAILLVDFPSAISLVTPAEAALVSGTLGVSGTPDVIHFALPWNDPGHVYYKDDGVGTTLDPARIAHVPAVAVDGVTPITTDAQLADPNLMGPGNTIDLNDMHSWWSIRPTSTLPVISNPAVLDGYSQGSGSPGAASPNTLAVGDNAVLQIELSGVAMSQNFVDSTYGLKITAGSSTVRGLAINHLPAGTGIWLDGGGSGNHVGGNFIGTDISGTFLPDGPAYTGPSFNLFNYGVHVSGSSGNVIGTDGDGVNDPAERNLIDGWAFGVVLRGAGLFESFPPQSYSSHNSVAGNYVGTDRTGQAALGNWVGVSTLQSANHDSIGTDGTRPDAAGEGNLISGNYVGIAIGAGNPDPAGFDEIVAGNVIGPDAAGHPMGNGGGGAFVGIGSYDCTIGGAQPILANVIAYNGGPGVGIVNYRDGANGSRVHGIRVQGNSIHDNGELGIDVSQADTNAAGLPATDGVDNLAVLDGPGTGANNRQHYPVIRGAESGAVTSVAGALSSSNPGPFTIDFYASAAGASGTVEGTRYLGHGTTNPDGSFSVDNLAGTSPGELITATATDAIGDTSEFSVAVAAQALNPTAGGPYTIHEGDTLALSAVVTDPVGHALTYSWDINGDGVFGDAAGVVPNLGWSQLQGLGIDDGPSTFSVAVRVDDGHGHTAISSGIPLTLIDTPPTANLSGPASGVAGQVLGFTVGGTDPSSGDQNAGFVYTIDWGDGTLQAPDIQTVARAPGNGSGVAPTHAYSAAGLYTATLTATDEDGATGPSASATAAVQQLTPTNLQQVVDAAQASGGSVSLAPPATGALVDAFTAIAGLSSSSSGSVSVALAGTTYAQYDVNGNVVPITASAPMGVTLTISCPVGSATVYDLQPSGGNVVVHGSASGNITLVGQSPALVVSAGHVTIGPGVTLTTATNSPTIIVTGGILTLRGATVQESTGFAQVAILIAGGTVDLGTASDQGGNSINVNGAGEWVRNSSPNPVSAVNDAFTVDGAPVPPSSLSGIVFADFNNDGQVDFGEKGIGGVFITLSGVDDLGGAVQLGSTTDGAGAYLFPNLRPGHYTVTEVQPAGYTQGTNTVGTVKGIVVGTMSGDRFAVGLTAGVNAMNYNYGERPAAAGAIKEGQTAEIGFWNNKRGQALIKALNGGVGTQLSDWLAATFPHMFGPKSGGDNLAGQNNAAVAGFFQDEFLVHGQKLDAQVLATALSVYVTDATLDNTGVGKLYGFIVKGNGVGTSTYNVGSNGAAFGVADNMVMTVMDLLLAVDARSVDGVLYNGDKIRQHKANDVFSDINEIGNIE